MAGVFLHPLRRDAGTTFLSTELYIVQVLLLFRRVQRIYTHVSIILHCSEHRKVLCHHVLSFLFLLNSRTSAKVPESNPSLQDGKGGLFLSEVISHYLDFRDPFMSLRGKSEYWEYREISAHRQWIASRSLLERSVFSS